MLILFSLCAPLAAADADLAAALVESGKQALVIGDTEAALSSFRAAHDASDGSLATEIWVLRGRIAAGELDDAFERIVEIEASGADVADLDYVIGAARYDAARRAEATPGGDPGGPYQEAAAYLTEAIARDGDAYPDAWKMLAASSRWIGETETASKAIDRALQVERDAETLTLASKIRVARGAALLGDEATKGAGRRAIAQGVLDAEAAIAALGDEPTNAGALADVHLQHAVGLLFLERKDAAAGAYAAAIEWDPTQVDFGQVLQIYTDADGSVAPFVDVLQRGAAAFESRWGAESESDASLWWWLGYGEFSVERYGDAIAAFERSLAKFPGFANAHWHIALSQYHLGAEHDLAAAASLARYAEADPSGFAATVQANARNAFYPGAILGRLYGAGELVAAADLAEVRLLANESDPLLWNDVGLMSRDAGEAIARGTIEAAARTPKDYYERSWQAYQRALELDRKPQYLNDGAVLLHYYLDRDFDRAIAMYDEAETLAESMLAEGGLDEVEEEVVRIALRDARNNRDLLEAKIEARRVEERGEAGSEGR